MNKIRSKYACIIADPPWNVQQRGNYGAVNHYDLMTLDQIKAMDVGSLAADDSFCWLWCTAGTLRDAYGVLESWGFRPVSIYCWFKTNLGLGNYLRNCCEFIVIGARGKAKFRFHSQPNFAYLPVQDHSHKPEEIFATVERCCEGPYLELFARRRMPGWDVWGNEIDSDVVIPRFPVPSYSEKACKNYTQEEMDAAVRDPVIKDLGANKKKERHAKTKEA